MTTLLVHTSCSLLSYVAFLLAFIAGMLFLIQERQLKHKTMGVLFHRLPSLELLDRVNFIALSAGFGLLSLGLLSGVLGSGILLGRWWIGDPKEYLTVGVWGAYCVLWLIRLRAAMRGRRVALLSMLGFTLVLFAALATHRLLPSLHPYL
jgi:ABC-type transport system involved in cytochrome c biogenesis permease subunit